MARSQKDDPLYGDMQHHTWNYHAENLDKCAPGNLGERNQPPVFTNPNVMSDNMFANPTAFPTNDVYLNKHPYNVSIPPPDNPANDENISMNNLQNIPRGNNMQNYGNAMLNLGNGQIVRVFFDENNQQIMIPVSGQYEMYNHCQGLREMPLQSQQPQHMFTINQDYSMNNNNVRIPQAPTTASQNSAFPKETLNAHSNVPTSSFLKEVLGNWEPNSSGTYSPFGQNYPLNHPDAPLNMMHSPKPVDLSLSGALGKIDTNSPKRNENSPLAETSNKKRIVAEVKPMRPTYSDVLAKNTKNNNQPDATRKTKVTNNIEPKVTNKTTNSKPDKPSNNMKQNNDDIKHKTDNKKLINTASSGSESGDIHTDDTDKDKRQKPNKKSKNKNNNSRKWSSMDDLTKDEQAPYNQDNSSQFMFIENNIEKPVKKDKKPTEKKQTIDKTETQDEYKIEDEEDDTSFVFQENQNEGSKTRKKKDRSYSYKSPKSQDKKKGNQAVRKRNKPGYFGLACGLAQEYLERWSAATWKAMVWFIYLLSDVCRMSAHLSFDLCASVFTQTYVSSQAVWRSTKDSLHKLADNKYLNWIDRKLGHTKLGFWRNMMWYKKETEADKDGDTKLSANIPLPATGDEAMKRLLACKGKDPYSILGVSVSCTDEEIKKYYRRQAFLVHPDKNQQPGAEEAFKILQHAFHLIGEPDRRSSYDRHAQESRHVQAAWSELSLLLDQLHDKMERAHNTIRCTACGRRHKRVLTERPCFAARYCAQCKIRHSAKEGDIWAESSMMGLLVMYYACMDGAVYQITQWASCQKKNLKQLRADCHLVQYRIVLGNKATSDLHHNVNGHDPNLEEFLNNLYCKSGGSTASTKQPSADPADCKKRRNKKPKM